MEGAEWVGVVALAIFSSLVVRALERFFVERGCCESDCSIHVQRRRASSVDSSDVVQNEDK